MPSYFEGSKVRPTPLQRRKIRMRAAEVDSVDEVEHGDQG